MLNADSNGLHLIYAVCFLMNALVGLISDRFINAMVWLPILVISLKTGIKKRVNKYYQ